MLKVRSKVDGGIGAELEEPFGLVTACLPVSKFVPDS